jgi:hypothetical protein
MTESPGYAIYQPGFYTWETVHSWCHNILTGLGYEVEEILVCDNPDTNGLGKTFTRGGLTVEIAGEGHSLFVSDGFRDIDATGYTEPNYFIEAVLHLVAQNVFFTELDCCETVNHFVVEASTHPQILDTIRSRLGGNEFGNVYYFILHGMKVDIPNVD